MHKKNKNTILQNDGQSTVEFAIVTASMLVIIIAIGLFWKLGDTGMFIEHVLSSASHHIQNVAGGIIGDVFSV